MCDEKKVSTTIDINTDGRNSYDWESGYPIEAQKKIRLDATYISLVFFLSFLLITLNYLGIFSSWLNLPENKIVKFEYIFYFSSSGMLGGVVFGLKYFYRVVARGYWTLDRRYWRILSPFISMSISFIVGCMTSSEILYVHNSSTNTWAIAFGFFSGYFADEAVGKMYEIATLLFGKTKNK